MKLSSVLRYVLYALYIRETTGRYWDMITALFALLDKSNTFEWTVSRISSSIIYRCSYHVFMIQHFLEYFHARYAGFSSNQKTGFYCKDISVFLNIHKGILLLPFKFSEAAISIYIFHYMYSIIQEGLRQMRWPYDISISALPTLNCLDKKKKDVQNWWKLDRENIPPDFTIWIHEYEFKITYRSYKLLEIHTDNWKENTEQRLRNGAY